MLLTTDFTPVSVQDLSVLTPTALIALRNLVYNSKEYRANRGYYGDVYTKIKLVNTQGQVAKAIDEGDRTEEEAEQLALAQTLAAVVFKLSTLPGIVVESEGSQERRNYYSSLINWEELARDVLNAFYIPLGDAGSGSSSYIVVDRNPALPFASRPPDEIFLSMGRWPYIIGSPTDPRGE